MPADRPRVLITAPFDPAIAGQLGERFEVTLAPPSLAGDSLAEGPHATALPDAAAIVTELDRVDRAALELAPALRLVISCRANPVNVDLAACRERGIPVVTTPGRNAEVTADLTFGLLLATVRRMSAAERWMRAGSWSPDRPFESYETFTGPALSGRTLGVLGGGAVGSRVVRRARGFGMRVQVYDPYLRADAFGQEATVVGLDELLSTSDVVTVHVPLTPKTTGLLGARELALLRPDAYLINAGRAAIIDEAALLAVLRERRIAGAGLDVFHEEPLPSDHELFGFEHVTLTPHIAGASPDVVVEHSRIAAEALTAWIDGRPLRGVADPA